jgi:hypothetical protein
VIDRRKHYCIAIYFNCITVAIYTKVSDHSRPILISANYSISGEIFGELSRFPQSEILYPTLGRRGVEEGELSPSFHWLWGWGRQ